MSERATGTVRRMNASRGYGFIESRDGLSRFFHRSMCLTPYELLHDGCVVYFTPDEHERGPRAKDIQKLRVAD